MSIDMNDDIFQDFLIEAGELLDGLNGQLINLEQSPHDKEMLNAVFRAFHTIKGGAGFLSLTALVELCHVAEDVFNVLRQGERVIDAGLMDIVLRSLDVLHQMFNQIRAGEMPKPAPQTLIKQLHEYSKPTAAVAKVQDAPKLAPSPAPDADQLFDALLQNATGDLAGGESNLMTEQEFEALLDSMPGHPANAAGAAPKDESTTGKGDLISDDEFENLLDTMYGQGKGPGSEQRLEAQPQSEPEPEPIEMEASADKATAAALNAAQAVKAETTVRVETKRLDDIMNLVGELVLVRNRLTTLKAMMNEDQVAKAISNLELVTSDLQAAVMKTRMQPVKKLFSRFPRVVRDLARSLGKEVRLELHGEETDLDKNLVEALADPLIHLVRNAVDHGIESAEDRMVANKPREGVLTLTAGQEGDQIMLIIQDDGRGMDPNVLRRKAVEKGLIDEEAAHRLSDYEVFNFIFAPGFSTKTEISDVSGRGVGMDVVKTRITELNGDVEVDSEKGKGTTILIRLPLTLAILPTLMVVLGNQRFALPLAVVSEAFKLDESKINQVDGQEVILVRDKPLPLFRLSHWLGGGQGTDHSADHVVLVQMGTRRYGFVVNQLIGQEEVVIKPLGQLLHGLPGFAGATITGDGHIALILDLQGLMSRYARRF